MLFMLRSPQEGPEEKRFPERRVVFLFLLVIIFIPELAIPGLIYEVCIRVGV